MSVSTFPSYDHPIFASADRWHSGNYDIPVLLNSTGSRTRSRTGRRSIHRRSRCSENCEPRQSARYLRRSRVERRARVKGISSVDYYRARCKATHTRSKSFSNVVKRRTGRRRWGEGTRTKKPPPREREAKGSPLGNQPPHWTVGGITH